MSRTPSTMLPLGTKIPTFNLPDTVSGNHYSPAMPAVQKRWSSCLSATIVLM